MREIWLKADLVVSEVRILTKCKDIIDKDEKATRKAKKRSKEKEQLVCDESWGSLFDISKCKCPMPAIPQVQTARYLVRVVGKIGFPEKKLHV